MNFLRKFFCYIRSIFKLSESDKNKEAKTKNDAKGNEEPPDSIYPLW